MFGIYVTVCNYFLFSLWKDNTHYFGVTRDCLLSIDTSHTFAENKMSVQIIELVQLARFDAEDNLLILICNGECMRIKNNYRGNE